MFEEMIQNFWCQQRAGVTHVDNEITNTYQALNGMVIEEGHVAVEFLIDSRTSSVECVLVVLQCLPI